MLTPDELAEIESTLLPALERHHLRLLAHALRSFQQAAGRRSGPLPEPAVLAAWAERQAPLAADAAFRALLLEQLAKAAEQIEAIAHERGQEPLALELADLAAWGHRQAQSRLAAPGGAPPG